jgi:FixJ family two-component response regulator
VIVTNRQGDVTLAVGAMKAGAIDFLETPYEPERLLTAIAARSPAFGERKWKLKRQRLPQRKSPTCPLVSDKFWTRWSVATATR